MPTYSDLDIDFEKHPGTGDVMRITDMEAIKTSMKNILNGKPFDKPFDSLFGTTIDGVLFEMQTPATAIILKRIIEERLRIYEPRVSVNNVIVTEDPFNQNATYIHIIYTVYGYPTQSVNIEFDRLK